MPVMDGFTVLSRIRQKNNLIPVLLLTARSEVDDKVKGLDMGANDYLTKPFAPAELLARIRSITRVQTAQKDAKLRFGNIELDTSSYELSSPSGNFHLAGKEYQMMEMLMQNPRRLIPAERLLERIWGYDCEVEINVVWVYISYLRKKLNALDSNVTIRAKRNAGYSLEVMES